MGKVRYIFLIMAACMTMTAMAGSYKTLTFVKTDGQTVSFSTSGLVITYDDFAHAVVTNDETSSIINLVEVDYMCFDDTGSTWTRGDVNGDGEVNVADVNAVIDIILGGTADDNTSTRADVNGDDEVNIADVNTLIDLILAS